MGLDIATKPTIDTIFSWTSSKHHIECRCHLRIYELSFDRRLAMISALDDYPSASFASSLHQLVYQVSCCYNLPLNKTMWVEHYPASSPENRTFYYHLILAFHRISWNPIERSKLELVLLD